MEAECQRLDLGSHVFSAVEYPFQEVKYFRHDLGPLWDKMALTSYFSSLSMMLGGGSRKEGPCASVE